MTLLETTEDLDDFQHTVMAILRLVDLLFHRVHEEIMAELRSNSPMPQHGFMGGASPRPATIDDL